MKRDMNVKWSPVIVNGEVYPDYKITQRSYTETLSDEYDENIQYTDEEDAALVKHVRPHSDSICDHDLVGWDRKKPEKILQAFEKRFPETMKRSRQMPLIREDDWPKWLCLPFWFWQQEAQKEYDKNVYPKLLEKHFNELRFKNADRLINPEKYEDYTEEDFDISRKPYIAEDITEDVGRVMFLGTWRYGKGYYKFNKYIYNALTTDTAVNGTLPASVLLSLPEYCVYIETKNLTYFEDEILGFWCMLNMRIDGRAELWIMLNNKDNPWPTPQDFMIIAIKDDTLENCIKEAIEYVKLMHLTVDPNTFDQRVYNQNRIDADLKFFNNIMPLILYICSQEPDICLHRKPGTHPKRPTSTKTNKHGELIFPVEKQKIWEVGFEIGEKIKQGIEQKTRGARDGVVPHIRRAHWHGFWKGPRNSERQFIYKWLPPIFVGEGEEYL